VRGVALLHPCLFGERSPSSVAELLCASRVGVHVLRSLRRVEAGEAFDRRAPRGGDGVVAAWAALRTVGDDAGTTLVLTGLHDRLVPPRKAAGLAYALGGTSALLDCGHLSHEEAAPALLDALVPFVRLCFG